MIDTSFLDGLAMFNHSNIYIPLMLDKYIRLLIVTPDMHRIHHSVVPKETDSNFGFNLSIWDRLFKTYTDQPEKGHLDMDIGLMEFKDPKYQLLHWMLLTPFVKTPEIKNVAASR